MEYQGDSFCAAFVGSVYLGTGLFALGQNDMIRIKDHEIHLLNLWGYMIVGILSTPIIALAAFGLLIIVVLALGAFLLEKLFWLSILFRFF